MPDIHLKVELWDILGAGRCSMHNVPSWYMGANTSLTDSVLLFYWSNFLITILNMRQHAYSLFLLPSLLALLSQRFKF
jgi:hypothetical protein